MKKTKWDLTVLYKSPEDPELEKDIAKIERAYRKFARQYGEVNLGTINTLEVALSDYEKLYALPKPLSYLFLLKSLDSTNKDLDARIALVQERLIKASNQVLFFELNLALLDEKTQDRLLSSPRLKNYHYFLSQIFSQSKHQLSEKEEALFRNLSLPSFDMWTDLTERLINSEEVEFAGASIPLSQAMNLIPELKTKDRRDLHSQVMQRLGSHAEVAEAEMNALLTRKKISDSMRGYKNPYAETLLSFETTDKELRALRAAVSENISISQEFYELKRDMMRLKNLSYADRNAEIGKINSSFTFTESVEILKEAFMGLDDRFVQILNSMVSSGQIDVFPFTGKTSGAFCYGTSNFPTYVLLNHVDTFDSLSTFAHEMGHAIHTELAKVETPVYQRYSTATAEFASTLFEDFVFELIFEKLNKREQRILLHNRINRDISTIFRQMAFFEFEVELHEEVRQTGYVQKERIAELLNKHTSLYLGPSVNLTEEDGSFFVTLSHIRRFFYVYSYAYGAIMSRAVSERIKEDKDEIKGVITLLSRGGADSPTNLFREIGINTESKRTYQTGLQSIEKDIQRLKEL